MDFFDCNCMVGRFGVPQPKQFHAADDLDRELKRCGITRALVYHAYAKELDPATGNAALADEIAGHAALEPCWVVMPHHTGEIPPPDELCDRITASGVKAARMFPQMHNYPLAEWCVGALLAALDARGIPLFVDYDQTNWEVVNAVCAAHPGLRLVVVRPDYRVHRRMYPLLECHQNLHIEIGWLMAHQGIEDCVQRFGAERLLFGSCLPHYTPGGPIAMVAYAQIPEADKALIAGGNLRRLLGEA
jgi:hypothetical protein